MTVVADVMAPNILEGFSDSFINKDEKVASSKKHSQFKTRVLKPYPIYNPNGENQYPIFAQNG